MSRTYVGVGANLKDPAGQVRDALSRIAAYPGLMPIAQSSLYRSAPLGPPGQPDYCNAVCAVDTPLSPDELLTALHVIERSMGRERPPVRWAPRLIDLDVLLYDTLCLRTDRLVLPHPELHKRNFVMVPLAEIAPELEIPGLGSVRKLAEQMSRAGLELI